MTKDITFQAINIYPRRHDTICIYKKHPMYLSGSQVRRERTGRHAPSTKEGPSMSRKKNLKGTSTVNRKEERLSDEWKKVPLDEMKKWVYPYGKRGLRYRCLSPPQIKLQGHLCRQPTVPRDTMSSLEELDLCIESGGPRLHVRSTTEPNSGAIESPRKSSTIESGE
jgi:hypothetical protein